MARSRFPWMPWRTSRRSRDLPPLWRDVYHGPGRAGLPELRACGLWHCATGAPGTQATQGAQPYVPEADEGVRGLRDNLHAHVRRPENMRKASRSLTSEGDEMSKVVGCLVAGCEGEHDAKGYCGMHYARVHNHGSPDRIRAPRRPKRLVRCCNPLCGKEFAVWASRAEKYTRLFCSRACQVAHIKSAFQAAPLRGQARIQVTCASCGKDYMEKVSRIANAKRHFCSHRCHSNAMRILDGNHKWKTDVTRKETGRRRCRDVFPNQSCEVCGHKAERHHRDGNTLNNASDNIAFLCRKHHMESDGRLQKLIDRNRATTVKA